MFRYSGLSADFSVPSSQKPNDQLLDDVAVNGMLPEKLPVHVFPRHVRLPGELATVPPEAGFRLTVSKEVKE